MIDRRRAREVAMQALYQLDVNRDFDVQTIRQFVSNRLRFPGLEEFCCSLIEGVRTNASEIDELIVQAADNWSIERMAAVDRNALRVAVFELGHCPEVPTSVAINEALEICRRYSTADSVAFVNGILDPIARQVRPETQQQT